MYHEGQESYTTLTATVSIVFFIKTIIGAVLLVLGCVIAFWILLMLFNIIRSPEEIALVQRISQFGKEGAEIGVLGETINFPPVTFEYGNIIISYGIVMILLTIGAGLAKAFLYAGAGLVKSDIKSLLEKLGEELARLWHYRETKDEKKVVE